jgi:hypothetical protein
MRTWLTWLHISDIHFHPSTEWRDSTVRTSLIEYLRAAFKADDSLRPDLVFCTGDIAYGETGASPLVDQYGQAKLFFDHLLVACGTASVPLPRERLFLVPGNHDVNRAAINSDAQARLTDWARSSPDHAEEINQRFNDRTIEFTEAAKRLDEYSRFVVDYLPHQQDADGRSRYAKIVDIEGLKVGIAGFNSAWSCAGPDDDRTVWLAALWQFNAADACIRDAAVRIGLIHHPVDWLNTADREIATRRISTDFHFWLHGHSHDAWVIPVQSHVTIAAGAVGARSTEEFGINLVHIDITRGQGAVDLHHHRAGGGAWMSAPVEHHAPVGHWDFGLPSGLRRTVAAAPPDLSPKRTIKLYGRDALLTEAAAMLGHAPFLLVYGLRGNGKTALIEELARRPPLLGKECVRILASPTTTADEVFRQLAVLLGETAEFPKSPQGDEGAIAAQIRRHGASPRAAWIWVDRAHHLLSSGGFRRPDVRNLLLGLHAAVGAQWHWVLEMRERPLQRPLGTLASECEVPGLNRASLAECLAAAAPAGRETRWVYRGDRLKAIYQWLGGGHGGHAHPHATQLLIEVARGRDETPWDVRERHRGDFEQRVEDVLLADLYTNVLGEEDRHLLLALALYRAAIPHDHADALENKLRVPGAWDSLDRRCLLASSADHELFYLHSLIASSLRTRQLGYADGEDDEAEFAPATEEPTRQLARDLHSAIASCWLEQLGRALRPTRVNVTRAVEAFHHLVAAGDADRVQGVAVELLSGDMEWARKRMATFQEHLFRTKAPLSQQLAALEYRAVLDPDDHAVQRFLGECWQKMEGIRSNKALTCFERACLLRRDFPPYWANLGRAVLARGLEDAKHYLSRLDLLEAECPSAIDDHVRLIKSACLKRIGAPGKAAALRMARITAGSRNAAFYSDEAKARLDAHDVAGALEILDLADTNCGPNDYTTAIRASALQLSDPGKAAALRMARITAGSRHAAFYSDEAKARLDAHDVAGALEILDLADTNCGPDDYTTAIRASALQLSDPGKAAALRMARITAGSRHATFYSDEAKARLDAHDVAGALEILDLADTNCGPNDYTATIRARVPQRN